MSALVLFYSRHQQSGLELCDTIQSTPDLNVVTCIRADDIQTRKRLKLKGVDTLPALFVSKDGITNVFERQQCYAYISELVNKIKQLKMASNPPPIAKQPPPEIKKEVKMSEEEKEFAGYMAGGKIKGKDVISKFSREREIEDSVKNPNPVDQAKRPSNTTSISSIQTEEVSNAPFSLDIIEESGSGGPPPADDDDPSGMGFGNDGDVTSRAAALQSARG